MIESKALELIDAIIEHLKADRELDPTSRVSEVAKTAIKALTVDYQPRNMEQLWPLIERLPSNPWLAKQVLQLVTLCLKTSASPEDEHFRILKILLTLLHNNPHELIHWHAWLLIDSFSQRSAWQRPGVLESLGVLFAAKRVTSERITRVKRILALRFCSGIKLAPGTDVLVEFSTRVPEIVLLQVDAVQQAFIAHP